MKTLLLAAGCLLAIAIAQAAEEPPTISTKPIGSPYYRHLAADLNVDLHELVKFERRGFGRTEMVTLILIDKISGAPLKDYGRRRLKDMAPLRDLAVEAGLDYDTLRKTATVIKQSIEAKGDKNLPPPMFEAPKTSTTPLPPPDELTPEPQP